MIVLGLPSQEAVEQTPGMFYAERDLGRELYTSGAFREAVEHLTRALSENQTSTWSRYLRGLAFYHSSHSKHRIQIRTGFRLAPHAILAGHSTALPEIERGS